MAMNWDLLETRYLQASQTLQMDSLSLNLTRLQALATSGVEEAVAYHLIRESQFFIEWSVRSINLETDMPLATELLSLQRQLSQWKLSWAELWNSEQTRQEIAQTAQQWCEQLQNQQSVIAS